MKQKTPLLLSLIWILAALFYFYEYILRVAPSVMTGSLMQSFGIDAATVGVISGVYFYIYAPMQLVVGIALDRYTVSKLIALAALICAFGAIGFGLSAFVFEAKIARGLIGLGSSFAFVGILYLSSHWFERSKRALLIGLANSIAMVGAVSGEGPLSMLDNAFGWRKSLVGLGIIGLILAGVIFWTTKKEHPELKQKTQKASSLKEAWESLLHVIQEGQSWFNALAASAFFATTVGLGGLWGVPFLVQSHGFDRSLAGFANSMIYVGWLVGSPLIGALSDKVHKRKPILLISSFLACICLCLLIYLPTFPTFFPFVFLFLTGAFSSAQLLHYSFIIDQHPPKATGSSIAFTNFVVAVAPVILLPLVGYILDFLWTGSLINGIHIYSPTAFRIALTLFPCSFMIAFLFTLTLKEKEPTC